MKTLWLDITGHLAQRRTEIYLSAAWVLHTWHRQTTTYVWLTFALLFCFYAAFHKFKVADPSLESIVKVLVWGKQAGETKDTDGEAEKKKKRQGYTVSEREPQRSDESAMAGLRMKEMKCVVERGWCMGKRVGLNANSSHLERLMDRGQHFCTYAGSLPPHSITRQSIKSSKKPRKALAEAPRVWCCFLLLYCFYLNLMCADFVCADLEWGDINTCLIFTNLCQGYFIFFYMTGAACTSRGEMLYCCKFYHLSCVITRIPRRKTKKTHGCISVEWMLQNDCQLVITSAETVIYNWMN